MAQAQITRAPMLDLDQRGKLDLRKQLERVARDQESITVTVTELGDYRRCRRRWDLGSLHRNKLTKIVPNKALSLGTAVHHALAEWLHVYNANTVVDRTSVTGFNPALTGFHPALSYMEACNVMIEKARAIYLAQMGHNIMDAQLQELYDIVELGKAMMENYASYWRAPIPVGFSVVGYEQKALIPIPGTPHFLQGRLDGIIADTHEQLYVLEHKTYNSKVRDEGLRMQDQFCGYAWMLHTLRNSGLWGGRVAGVAYDGMWKRAAPPKGKTLDDLFVRVNIPFTPAHLDEYELFLVMQVIEMAGQPYNYVNRTWDARCTWDCQFMGLCNAITRDEDWEYILRSEYTQRDDDEIDADDPEMRG